jgi:hypothetical protein
MNTCHPRVWATIAIALAALLVSPRALAFSKEGHQVIVLIALENLSPKAKVQVNRLFRADEKYRTMTWVERMEEASIWADEIKSTPRLPVSVFGGLGVTNAEQSRVLHYADYQGENLSCPDNRCVLTAIKECCHALTNVELSAATRLEAVKFLIHFVGDVHQPLHSGNVGDRGGNDIKMAAFLDRRPPARGFNLHEVWDDLIIQQADNNPVRLAKRLGEALTGQQKIDLKAKTDPDDWARESHVLAVKFAYVSAKDVPLKNGDSLDQAYYERCLPIVEHQLQAAGIRLADLLNRLFESAP